MDIATDEGYLKTYKKLYASKMHDHRRQETHLGDSTNTKHNLMSSLTFLLNFVSFEKEKNLRRLSVRLYVVRRTFLLCDLVLTRHPFLLFVSLAKR